VQRIELNGNWKVARADARLRGEARSASSYGGHSKGTFPGSVPGDVYADLLAAGKIPDPFVRDNETALQWIGETDWVYARTVEVPAEFLAHDRVVLRCEGLDTLATIVVNGRTVATTDNMFRTWEFDVRDALVAGPNRIEVRFASAVRHIQDKQSSRSIPSWAGPKEVRGRAWLRKEPCNFGWDWGPVLVTCGIWRPIRLIAFDTARLADVSVRQVHEGGRVRLVVAAAVETVRAAALGLKAAVSFNGHAVADVAMALPAGQPAGTVELDISDPQLWWPNGLGAQPLYTVEVSLHDAEDGSLDVWKRRVGLRTLRLDRHPDAWGESFQFVANGVPFFAKGGNWIPPDAILGRMTRERWADLLDSVAEANMNMLRVWGGGVYEHDDFYDLCDERGITIWQDFMFACSTYPTFDEGFLRSVKAEFEDNIRRIRHHACLALWCGNNELEQGLVGEKWNDWQMSWEDYSRLFDKLLPEVVSALDPDRDYWPCSPHTPKGDRKNFNDPTCGDAHLWDVWHGRKPFEWYRTCEHRFNSEFGFQSFPEPKTVYGYTAPQDRNITSFVMEHHQRSGIGNTVIMQYMLDWFRLPDAFENSLWLSQILQGMAMKYAVEHWRRAMPRGMGTLYWQINDCWPVASWASLDFFGRWKALQYMAKKFYAPLLVSGVEDIAKGTVEVHVTSDRREAVAGTVAWSLTDLDGEKVAGGRLAVRAAPGANQRVATVDVSKWLAKHGPRNLLFWLEIECGGERVAENLVLFARPKHLELEAPGLQAAVQTAADGSFDVVLKARKPALWAWLQLEGLDAALSDNFVHLRPGTDARVHVEPSKPVTVAALRKALRLRSLVDTYR
jgi:beta-mannosidase